MSSCLSNILLELSRFFCILQVPLPSHVPAPPASNDPAHRMSLPLSTYDAAPNWFCTCQKCGSEGKQLTRSDWYRHNPGGKITKLAQRTQEEIARWPNPAPPRPSTRRKRRHEEALDADQTHISKRVAGPSTVRTSPDYNICASIERYQRKYASRVFALRWEMLMDTRRPQK